MKKIILIIFALLLTSCFEDSAYIKKSCYLKDESSLLNRTITYEFEYKENIISSLSIIYTYSGDTSAITSIKTSHLTEINNLNMEYEILNENDNEYEVKYNLSLDTSYNNIITSTKKTELVELLEEKKYICE